ncbi:MAG: hypothetical protein V3S25_05625 [Nitrospirales bacterium]
MERSGWAALMVGAPFPRDGFHAGMQAVIFPGRWRFVLDLLDIVTPTQARRVVRAWQENVAEDPDIYSDDPLLRRYWEKLMLPEYERIAEPFLHDRGYLKSVRDFRREHDWPLSEIPLVRHDDAQLRALVALRCLQQEYETVSAERALRAYLQRLGVPERNRWGERFLDEMLDRVVAGFLFPWPDGLPSYVAKSKKWIRADQARQARAEATNGSVSVHEFARLAGRSPSSVYRLIRSGDLKPVSANPYRLDPADADRLPLRPGVLYRAVMELRGGKYEANRMWVKRRRDEALSDREILVMARGSVS